MIDVLVAPGAPYYLAALAGVLLAGLGLVLRPTAQATAVTRSSGAHMLAGQIAGVTLAALLVGVALTGGAAGTLRTLLLGGALAAYLGLGMVLPRRPLVRRQREAAVLRRLTPGFIAFVRVALGSFEAPVEIMRRYTARPSPGRALMQGLVAEAITLGQERRLRPFAALAAAARPRGCRELSEVAEALAQAEAEGASVETVLVAQQETLELILQGEFKRTLRRRTMYLLMMVAISLVVGILMNLLYVMTGGGSVLTQLG